MGYVVDLQNKGLPKKKSVVRMTFRSPLQGKKALKVIRRNKGYNPETKEFFMKENSHLFTYEHVTALKPCEVHMQDRRRYPVLWKFQSENNCLPMEWFCCPPSTVPTPERSDEYVCTFRNIREIRHVRFSDLQKMEDMCRAKLTATQTVVSWDIETHSDFRESEDSFPRPHRAESFVINIGVNVSKVIGTADKETQGVAENGTKTEARDVLVLGNTALSTKCNIKSYECEAAMLLAFLVEYTSRSDVLIDYNGKSFDWPFVLNRLLLFQWFGTHRSFGKTCWVNVKRHASQYRNLIKECAAMAARGDLADESHRSKIFNKALGIVKSCEQFLNQKQAGFPLVSEYKWKAVRKKFMNMDDKNPRLPVPPDYLLICSNYMDDTHFEKARHYFSRAYDDSQCMGWNPRIESCLNSEDQEQLKAGKRGLQHKGLAFLSNKVLEYIDVKLDFGLIQRIGNCGPRFTPTYGWFKNVLTTKTTARSCVDSLGRCGLFVLDMYGSTCVRELNLENYSLDNVTKHLNLGGKDDSFHFDYEKMFRMWREGDPNERTQIAEYCIVDVDILFGVFTALQVMQRNTQTAFASRMALFKTCGGMQAKVWPLLFDAAYREHSLLLNLKPHAKTESYEGAIVLDPQSDLYKPWDPRSRHWTAVATLDFASLYPSVMQKDNICYTTFLEDEEVAKAKQCPDLELVGFTDIRDKSKEVYFVQSPTMDDPRTGLLPYLEYFLKKLRDSIRSNQKGLKRDREALRSGGDPTAALPDQSKRKINDLTIKINNLEQMQLAIKLIMNSIYGFLGAPGEFAVLPQVHCAAAITQSGRRCILSTRDMCLTIPPARILAHMDQGGLELKETDVALMRQILAWNPDFQVGCVGGDTDSVFLLFKIRLRCDAPGCGGERACRNCYDKLYHRAMWVVGEVLAAIATYILFAGKPSMILEMEKFNSIMVIIVKKKYIGLVHKGPTKKGSIGGKGTNVRRGDTIGLVKEVYRNRMCPLLFDPSPDMLDVDVKEKVMDVVHDAYETLRDGGFAFKLFSQRKKLKRPADQYKQSTKKDGTLCALPQHVQVAKQILQRTGRPVEVGTYVRWVITKRNNERRFVDLTHYLSLAEQNQHDPIDVELYMSRLEIVGELLNSFLEPDVFRQMVKLYIKDYQSKQLSPKKPMNMIRLFKGRDDKRARRDRLMRMAGTLARKSILLKKSLKRTRKRKQEDTDRITSNLNARTKKSKAQPSRGIFKYFQTKSIK